MALHLGTIGRALARPFKRLGKEVKKGEQKVQKAGGLSKVLGALKKEAQYGPMLDKDARSALSRMQATDPSLTKVLEEAYGYAIFPHVGKASVVLGGAFGLGEVFEHEHLIGYAAIIQMTIGVQLGGQTFNQLIVFDSESALDAFKQSKASFAANASAVIVTAGAGATHGKGGTRVFVQPNGGLGLELDLGGQKFIFKPAAIGRVRSWVNPVEPGSHDQA